MSYEYYMDEAKLYDINELLNLLPWANAISYNQMRYIVWAALKPHLKKKSTTPQDLMTFAFDKGSEFIDKEPQLKEDEIVSLREAILKQYKKGGDK